MYDHNEKWCLSSRWKCFIYYLLWNSVFVYFLFFLVDMSELLEILEACFIGNNYEPFM